MIASENTTPAASNCSRPMPRHASGVPLVAGGATFPVTMKIRRRVLERPEPRGVTPRRLAAAERVLARERQRLALFVRQVLVEQETAEDRIRRIDADNLRHDQAFRDLAAKHWREGRRMLRSLPEAAQTELLEAWNRSSIPQRRLTSSTSSVHSFDAEGFSAVSREQAANEALLDDDCWPSPKGERPGTLLSCCCCFAADSLCATPRAV